MNTNIFRRSKKGDEPGAGNSAVVLIIIAGVIIAYLLFISPSERAKLLEGDSSLQQGNTFTTLSEADKELLIQESIGKITKSPYTEKIHSMSAVTISTQTNAQAIQEKSSLYIRNAIFTKNFPELAFDLNPNLADNLKLSFNVAKAKGLLMIYVNGNEIFAGRIEYTTPPAIEIPKRYLQEENNLVFYLDRPSWAFWRVEEYELKNVKIFGDITDTSKDSAQVSFALTDFEKENLETSKLYFFPECSITEVGKLSVHLNDNKIYSAIPDCGIINFMILDIGDIEQGRNTLSFNADAGTYLIDQIKVKTTLEDQVYPVYYFDLKHKYFYDEVDDEDDEDYKYFCDDNGYDIILRYDRDTEETNWECDDEENCLGQFVYYGAEKSESKVVNKLCDDLDDDEFEYFCDDDDKSILFRYDTGNEGTHDITDEYEDTGWNCASGKTCKDKSEIYDREKLEDIVKDDLCYYDDNDEDNYIGDYNLRSDYDIKVSLRFPDNDFKELTVWVNGYRKSVSTMDSNYDFYIDDYVYPGSNSVELVPETDNVRISDLKIEIEED